MPEQLLPNVRGLQPKDGAEEANSGVEASTLARRMRAPT